MLWRSIVIFLPHELDPLNSTHVRVHMSPLVGGYLLFHFVFEVSRFWAKQLAPKIDWDGIEACPQPSSQAASKVNP